MTKTEHILATLAEECAEVAQATSKALRFGLDEPEVNIARYTGKGRNNRERIADEVADMVGVIEMLTELGITEIAEGLTDRERIDAKKAKVAYFLQYAIEQGAVTPE